MPSVIKYGDVSGVESDFEQAPVGLYVGKVAEISQKKSKNDEPMVEVVFEVVKDANGKKLKKKYGRLWFYAPLDPEASWARRLRDLVTGFGLKPKGGNLAGIVGKEALIRLREDTDLDGEYRPNIGKILPLTAAKKAAPAPDEDEEEDEETEDNGALDELSRAELKQLIKDEELDVRVLKSMTDDDLREAITEARPEDEDEEEDDEEEEEEEDDEEEEEDEGDNYDDLGLAELRQELKDRELDSKGRKPVLIARLRTDDAEDPV